MLKAEAEDIVCPYI